MPALVAGIHVFKPCNSKDVDGRDIGVRKHAVLRTAMPGHDESRFNPSRSSFRRVFALSVAVPAFSSFSLQYSSVPLFSDALPSVAFSSGPLSQGTRPKA